jgi:hypothetical protein
MTTIDHTELPSMLATLCSYENLFGPYHPQTLRLMAEVANAYWQAGELGHARPLLERAVGDLGRYLGTEHHLRLRAIATLRDLFGRAARLCKSRRGATRSPGMPDSPSG